MEKGDETTLHSLLTARNNGFLTRGLDIFPDGRGPRLAADKWEIVAKDEKTANRSFDGRPAGRIVAAVLLVFLT